MLFLLDGMVVRANSKAHALNIAKSKLAPRDVQLIDENGPHGVILKSTNVLRLEKETEVAEENDCEHGSEHGCEHG